MIEQIWKLINGSSTLSDSEYLFYVIGLILLWFSYIVASYISRNFKNKIFNFFSNLIFKKNNYSIVTSAETYTKIHNELISLRIKMKADRSFIFQFHNGEHFSGMNPRWKMSQTFETCSDGTTYESRNLQNIDVTLFWDLMQIFHNKLERLILPGISIFQKNLVCSLNDCLPPKRLYLIDVSEMDGNRGYTKSLLIQQGSYYLLLNPIINVDGEPIGIIGVSYCSENALDEIIMKNDFEACYLCQTGTNVGLAWALDPSLRKKSLVYSKKKLKK